MEISSNDIRKVFQSLKLKELSREKASNWAFVVQEADDQQELIFKSEAERLLIYSSLDFILGYDLQVSAGIYLHTEEDLDFEISEFEAQLAKLERTLDHV